MKQLPDWSMLSSPDGFPASQALQWPLRGLLSAIRVPSSRHSVKGGHTFPRDCNDVEVLRLLRTANQPGKHPVLFDLVSVALSLKSGRVCLENNILLPYTMDKNVNTSVLKSMYTILYIYIYTLKLMFSWHLSSYWSPWGSEKLVCDCSADNFLSTVITCAVNVSILKPQFSLFPISTHTDLRCLQFA